MKMPIMNGWDFAYRYNELYKERSPIIIMTAASEASKRATDIGAQGWIEKPFELEKFLKKIKEYCKSLLL